MSAPVTTAAAGTTVTRGSAIANVVDVKGGGVEVGERNTTHLGSTWKSSAPVLPKGKKLTLTINFTKAAHNAYVAEAAAGTVTSTVLTTPADSSGSGTAATLTFLAYISDIEFGGMQEDGTVTVTVEFTPVESVAAA